MALQSQSSSPLSDFGALMRRRLWHILLPFAFITAIGVMLAQLMPRHYMVQTMIKMAEQGMPGTGSVIQRDVSSAQNDMKAEPLVRAVIESQEWPEYVGLTEREKIDFVTRVIGNVKPKVQSPSRGAGGSNYITVQYTDANAARAELFLNTLRDKYIEGVLESVRAEAKTRLDTLKDLRKEQEDAWKDAERVRDELAKSKGLSATQPSRNSGQSRSEDPMQVQLDQSIISLADAKVQLREERARLEMTEHLKALEPLDIPFSDLPAPPTTKDSKLAPEDDPVKRIKALEEEAKEKREKQKDYRPLARAYQVLADEIAKLEQKIKDIQEETGTGAGAPRTAHLVRNPEIAKYELTIKDATTKIAGLEAKTTTLDASIKDLNRDMQARHDVYTQLAYLSTEVDRALTTYTNTDFAYRGQELQVKLLGGALANPFQVVEIAKASDVPLSPNVPVFIAISVFLGLAVGLGAALAAEFLRNGFKGIPDLTRSLSTPVLGAVNLITTRAEVRKSMTRHAMIAASSGVIVCSILWLTWAYQHDPLRRLGSDLTQFIDDVRQFWRP